MGSAVCCFSWQGKQADQLKIQVATARYIFVI